MRPPTLSVRLPSDVRRELELRARHAGRTLHGEIIATLTAAVTDELDPKHEQTKPGSSSTLSALFARGADRLA